MLTYPYINQPMIWRDRTQSITRLRTMFQTASQVGGMTQAAKMQTQFGLKDTFQDFFANKIFALGRKARGSNSAKQEAIDHLVKSFPADITSPVWRIKGLFSVYATAHVLTLILIHLVWRPRSSSRYARRDFACCSPGVCQIFLARCNRSAQG